MQEMFGFSTFRGIVSPIHPLFMGKQKCRPLHHFGRRRDCFLIHYVHAGRGKFTTRGTAHSLKAGQAFFITPGEEHWYQADAVEPWEYWWFAFKPSGGGDSLCRLFSLSRLPAVIELSEPLLFEELYRRCWGMLTGSEAATAAGIMAALLNLMENLFSGCESLPKWEGDLWSRYEDFVTAGYGDPMTVEQIAHSLGMSRSSLHRLVRKHTGVSPKEHLTRLRMEAAQILLKDMDRPIYQVASLVGYQEYQSFERQFRTSFEMTPRAYRRSLPV